MTDGKRFTLSLWATFQTFLSITIHIIVYSYISEAYVCLHTMILIQYELIILYLVRDK